MPDGALAPPLPEFSERVIVQLPEGPRPGHGTHDIRAGFAIDMWFRLESLDAGQVLVDNRTETGKGYSIETTTRGTIQVVLNDERTESRWECDPVLETGELHHVAVIVDGGPKVISFVLDGVLNDGGEHRQFGWGRFNPQFRNVPGDDIIKIGPILDGKIERLRIFDRYLRTSEAIANYRAGL